MLSTVAGISGVYDFLLGVFLIFGSQTLATMVGVPPPFPPIYGDLNALFLMSIGLGYYFPWRDPERHRGYMWVMGPFLKGVGALIFVLDYCLRGSPLWFLVFAAIDGSLALITLYALMRTDARRGS